MFIFPLFLLSLLADGTCIMEEDAHMVAMPTSYELTDRQASEVHEISMDEREEKEGIDEIKGDLSSLDREKGRKGLSDVSGVFLTSSSASSSSTSSSASPSFSPNSPVKLKKVENISVKPVAKLMTVEERGEGAVGWDVYRGYFKAANRPILIVCLILSFVLGERGNHVIKKLHEFLLIYVISSLSFSCFLSF